VKSFCQQMPNNLPFERADKKMSADSRDRLLYAEVTLRSFDEHIEKLN